MMIKCYTTYVVKKKRHIVNHIEFPNLKVIYVSRNQSCNDQEI